MTEKHLTSIQQRWIREAAKDANQAQEMVQRVQAGEPLQYVLGRWAFRNLDLIVDKRVLIPRPETEQLVEAILPLVGEESTVVDLGTGSGAIALSIAREISSASVYAVDISADALEVARLNSKQTDLDIHLLQGSWFDPLPIDLKGHLDLVISNPPYVAENHEIEVVVEKWEPHGALFSGRDGLDDIKVIIAEAPFWLKTGGHLAIEFDPRQARAVEEMAIDHGFFDIKIEKDFTGRERWIIAGR